MNNWQWNLARMKRRLTQWLDSLHHGKRPKYNAKLKMCPSCGKLISSEASICEYCETPVGHIQVKAKRAQSADGDQHHLETIYLVFGVCAFFFVLAAMRSTREAEAVSDLLFSYWSPDGQQFRLLGASSFVDVIENGEFWRLATYIFLHGNLIHIGFNLSALAFLGPQITKVYTIMRFWLITFVCGIGGAAVSASTGYIFGNVGTVGFSGVLFGYLGALYAFHKASGDLILAQKFKTMMIYANVFSFALTFLGFPLDNFCHLGGMFIGMGLGFFLFRHAANPNIRRLEIVVFAACLALWGWGLFHVFSNTMHGA